MKTTFTLLMIIGLSIHAFAQHSNPFGKSQEKQTVQKANLLKNGHLDFLPSGITTDLWVEGAWLFDQSTAFEYDGNGNVLVMTSAQTKVVQTYDANNNLLTSIVQEYDGVEGTYVNNFKSNFSYDSQGFQSETISSQWIDNAWQIIGGSKTVREYDTNGEIISEIGSFYQTGLGWFETYGYKDESIYLGELLTQEIYYDRVGGVWEPQDKSEYFYDATDKPNMVREYEHDGNDFVLTGRYIDLDFYLWNGNLDEEVYLLAYTYQTYNGSGDINNGDNYTNNEKLVASYPEGDGNGTPPVMIMGYSTWIDGGWVNSERETIEEKDNYLSELSEEWQEDQWLETYYVKTYTTPTLAYQIEHTYVSGILVMVDKSTQTFDAFGNLEEDKGESHDGDENWLQNYGSKYEITYEGTTAKMMQRITQTWDEFMGLYVNESRETFNYTSTNIDTETQGASVYPTIISTKINIVSGQDGLATFYSLTGSAVLQVQVYTGANSVSTAAIPAGYYILKVNNDTFKVMKK